MISTSKLTNTTIQGQTSSSTLHRYYYIPIAYIYIVKLRHFITAHTQPPKSDPYMELQPTDDSNTAYTEPVTTGSTSTRHTYCNTLDIENEKTTDDYEQPEDKYEAVDAPKGANKM